MTPNNQVLIFSPLVKTDQYQAYPSLTHPIIQLSVLTILKSVVYNHGLKILLNLLKYVQKEMPQFDNKVKVINKNNSMKNTLKSV